MQVGSSTILGNLTVTRDTRVSGNIIEKGLTLEEKYALLSHSHTIANIAGLQTALDGKVDDSQVLTNVPAGAKFTDTVYTHPTHPGDDFSVDTGALTGALVVSDIDINVTTDTLGHVTDANGVVSTRTLTLGDLGYTGATNANNYTHPSSHPATMITEDASHRFATDSEKTSWNNKPDHRNAADTTPGAMTFNGVAKSAGTLYGGTTAPTASTRLNYDGYFYATRAYNAVYNDLAEYMYYKKDEIIKPGDIVSSTREGLVLAKNGDRNVVGAYSDTYGYALGADDMENKIPVAISGRVLINVDIENPNPGDLVVAGENGIGEINNNPPIGTVVGKIFDGIKHEDGRYWMIIMLG